MGSNSSTIIIMRLIILTLSALLAFAVAEREFSLCAREEKVCPGGVKPKTPCADGSSPRCPSGRTDTCKPKSKRCADGSEPARQCASGKPHCPWTTKNKKNPWTRRELCRPGSHCEVSLNHCTSGGFCTPGTIGKDLACCYQPKCRCASSKVLAECRRDSLFGVDFPSKCTPDEPEEPSGPGK